VQKVITPLGGTAVVSQDESLSAYFALTRGTTEETVKQVVSKLVESAKGDPEKMVDVFALWMHTRDSRGGKGERLIAEQMFFELMEHYPKTTMRLLRLLPETYGSWKDINSILARVSTSSTTAELQVGSTEQLIQSEALSMYRERLLLDEDSETPSLAGKWAPREKKKDHKVAKALAKVCFPESAQANKDYRKLVSGLNAKLSTPEVAMCGHNWQSINPTAIPAKCLTTKRKAFLNQKLKGTGDRFPDDADRVECSKKMKEAMKSKTGKSVHGAAVQPHELVKDYITALMKCTGGDNNKTMMEVESDIVVEAQWRDMVKTLRKDLGDGLGKLVPIADMSTDVGLLPAVVAHAILAAECAPPAFRNRILTFSAQPKWLNLENNDPLFEDCQLLQKVRTVLNERAMMMMDSVKDLEGAIKMILEVCQAAQVPADEVASLRLLVLSDMSFETAWKSGEGRGPWSTQHEALCQRFEEAGYPQIPEVVYWSVASKALAKGEKFKLPGLGDKLELELSSDSASILCGACLAYDAKGNYIANCCYSIRTACGGALKHSGDTLINNKSKHRIEVDFRTLPPTVDQLFFSLCACGPSDLSHFQSPYINLTDGITKGNLCRYEIADAGKSPSALMAAVVKVPGGGWAITALGDDAKTKCCGNYNEMMTMCKNRSGQVGFTTNNNQTTAAELALPTSNETIGVRLLSGFSADMLRCLVVSEEEEEAMKVAAEAEKAAVKPRLMQKLLQWKWKQQLVVEG
jgi:stress response protein SCP2